jgi:hypothetical protein
MSSDSTDKKNADGSKDSQNDGSKGSSDSGSNDGASSGDGSSNTDLAPIDGLTDSLNDLKDNGKADVKLSAETRDKYLKLISTFRDALQAQRKNMNGLEAIGNVGLFESANQTKRNLQIDVTGIEGIQQSTDKYLDYLDAFADTVKKAADRLLHNG